eukprot:TRINITY_DN14887_c0_g1_i1.p1 TRINITY_DN14887_c0_g1~~TRINITY_DN14887_c0_g1_i1.p1  ORF type:complete len:104 (-),score=19.87 TRINITY_DN14887_c0_g1_i1:21-332(-)
MGACTAGFRGCCGHDAHGEYEFSDVLPDANQALSITGKQSNNDALVKHIRSTAAKASMVLSEDMTIRGKQLEEIVHYAPLLRLKVINGNLPVGTILTLSLIHI